MGRFFTSLSGIGKAMQAYNRRRRRGCLLRLFGCLGLLILVVALLVVLLFGLFGKAEAQAVQVETGAITIQLVIDNSNSMFDKAGVGSDPELLRMDAARLFIEYLGVDDTRFRPAAGLIFFGSAANQVAAPVPLADTTRRAALTALLTEPERMGWTDQLGALQLARQGLTDAGGRRVIILLTDGKPEWRENPTHAEQVAYLDDMARFGRELGEQHIALFIILLAGPATDGDAEIATIWQPMWEAMAAGTEDGRFLTIRNAQDLPEAYHDIVVALTDHQSDGAVIDDIITGQGLREAVAVEPGLARLTLVIRKSNPDTRITVRMPDNSTLSESAGGNSPVSRTGGLLEEIWTVTDPGAGTWMVLADGEGRLTVWKDYIVATPSPVPAATAKPTATPTAEPSPTPQPSPAVVTAPINANMPPATPTLQTEPARGFPWWLLLVLGSFLCAIAGVALARHRRGRPVITGRVHVQGGAGNISHDLYSFGKPIITIGAADADIPLPGETFTLTLQIFGESDIIARANPDVHYNGHRLLKDQPVYDGDTFTGGQLRLRYENLQRRRTRNQKPRSRSLPGSAPNFNR